MLATTSLSSASAAAPPARHAPAPLVRLVGLHKTFGSQKVLDGVSLDIERGKTTVIIGPSGTGKSVLLKHIVGLLRPDRGEVWFEDQRVDRMRESELVAVRRRIGLLFQMGALFDSMNVRDNICFPLAEHLNLSREEAERRCGNVLSMVGLAGVQGKMPEELSGGQRKRVALARAIVLEPSLVLYDEPTTGLDPVRADVINELIVALSRQMGITSLVVTHDMASADKIADRIVMLYDGRIIADASPQSLRQVDNDLVQRFIQGRAESEELEAIHRGFRRVGAEVQSAEASGGDAPASDAGKGSPS